MLVVIDIPYWDGLADELRMLQQSQDQITSDPEYDPDEPDEALTLKTDVIAIDVARVVGTLRQVNAANPGDRYAITPLAEA